MKMKYATAIAALGLSGLFLACGGAGSDGTPENTGTVGQHLDNGSGSGSGSGSDTLPECSGPVYSPYDGSGQVDDSPCSCTTGWYPCNSDMGQEAPPFSTGVCCAPQS